MRSTTCVPGASFILPFAKRAFCEGVSCSGRPLRLAQGTPFSAHAASCGSAVSPQWDAGTPKHRSYRFRRLRNLRKRRIECGSSHEAEAARSVGLLPASALGHPCPSGIPQVRRRGGRERRRPAAEVSQGGRHEASPNGERPARCMRRPASVPETTVRETEMLRRIGVYLEMIKVAHTVFALPFALVGTFLAAREIGASHALPSLRTILYILLAMVGARSAAMGFNRLADAGDRREKSADEGSRDPGGEGEPRRWPACWSRSPPSCSCSPRGCSIPSHSSFPRSCCCSFSPTRT